MSSIIGESESDPARRPGGNVTGFSARLRSWYGALDSAGRKLTPLFDLSIRLGVAWIFWKSGLTKIASWQSTVLLFTHEYDVPLLSPEVAAALGTTAELTLPVLLAFGLAGRLAAAALFIFNAVAVISYPGLSLYGQLDHLWWGALMLITVFRGPGKWSIDHLIKKRYWAQS